MTRCVPVLYTHSVEIRQFPYQTFPAKTRPPFWKFLLGTLPPNIYNYQFGNVIQLFVWTLVVVDHTAGSDT